MTVEITKQTKVKIWPTPVGWAIWKAGTKMHLEYELKLPIEQQRPDLVETLQGVISTKEEGFLILSWERFISDFAIYLPHTFAPKIEIINE